MAQIFDGLKVIDVSQVAAAPIAARMLGDFGADVIHVENPEGGDIFRNVLAGSSTNIQSEFNHVWEHYNRNKRSVTIDITRKQGQEILHKLLETADILVTNLRPYQLKKFELEYEYLKKLNPRLIGAYLSGFGPEGEEKDHPAYDHTAFWARGGIPHRLRSLTKALQAKDAVPPAFVSSIGDHVTGLTLISSIFLALYAREKTGLGREVTASLFQTAVHQISWDINAALTTGEDCISVDFSTDVPNPFYNQYQTRDERWLLFSALNPLLYLDAFLLAIERVDLIGDPRFETPEDFLVNQLVLREAMTEAIKSKDLAEWVPIFREAKVPYAPVQNMVEVANDPQALANGFYETYEHPVHGSVQVVANPINIGKGEKYTRMPGPEFSQHTEETLIDLGYTKEDIDRLREQGIIA